MNVRNALKVAERFVGANSPALLSGLAVSGTLATTYLTGKASFRASELILEHEIALDHYEEAVRPEFGTKEKVLLVWKEYIPAATMVVTTIGCIVTAQSINSTRLAALAAAYKMSDKAYAEYKEKVLDQFGEKEEQKVRDSLAQDRVDRMPVNDGEVVRTPGGDVLCFDPYSSRYFRSDMESLRKAQNDLNEAMYATCDAVTLTDWYDRIGLQSTKMSDEIGWNMDNACRIKISTTVSDRNEPCLVVDFGITPFPINSYHGVH